MANRSDQKIRFVKCPKCLTILQEDEDVPVYKCGGCSAILQAKRRSFVSDSAGDTELAQVRQPRNSTSSGKDTILPSSPSRSSDQKDMKARDESMESTEKEMILPSSTSRSSDQEDEKARDESMESTEKDTILPSSPSRSSDQEDEKTQDESMKSTEKHQESSLSDSKNNEEEDNTKLESDVIKTTAKAIESETSSESLNIDNLVTTEASNSSSNGEEEASSSSTKRNNEITSYPDKSLELEGPGGYLNRQQLGLRIHGGWYSSQLSYSLYSTSQQRPRWRTDVEEHHRYAGRRPKRHVRPTAGGAPFINCYNCSENLQLPVDFIIFKKKNHLLKCGTCSTILSFSVQSRTHLVPNRSSSSSTSEFPGDKPEKLSSDEARGSPLHRLMGYSTISQVFKASQPSSSSY